MLTICGPFVNKPRHLPAKAISKSPRMSEYRGRQVRCLGRPRVPFRPGRCLDCSRPSAACRARTSARMCSRSCANIAGVGAPRRRRPLEPAVDAAGGEDGVEPQHSVVKSNARPHAISTCGEPPACAARISLQGNQGRADAALLYASVRSRD